MNRYVDLDEKVTAEFYDEEHEERFVKETTVEDILSICDSYTEVDAEPVKHGKWIPWKYHDGFRCGICKEPVYNRYNYCPNCGAKMQSLRKEQET
jgi:hypothetical protein